MTDGLVEIYHPRAFSDHGVWNIGPLEFKVYGLLAKNKSVSAEMTAKAKHFIQNDVLGRVEKMGDSNDLGFVIIHPGDLGVSISVHWWAQGSVLCQHNYRQLYGSTEPMDTTTRPVVACVWELALINAEQEAWRKTMMGAAPDRAAYLATQPSFQTT